MIFYENHVNVEFLILGFDPEGIIFYAKRQSQTMTDKVK